jgi:ABC-2 type transport system ATP-binding protein
MEQIKTVGLTKYYGKSRGIEELNLTVEQGDFFGFIGPNGAGKSTTIRTLLGLISPSAGSAQVLGMDIRTDVEKILANVGFMPSEAMFYNGMRVRDIIKMSAELRKKNCADEAKQLCEALQLDTSKKIEELSLGNRKKAAIVCAMQHKPDLYIFDEPTSGLDPLIQREFFSLLAQRNREGATVFLSSHVLSEIQRYCNRAAVIRDGRLIACDSVESLTSANAKRVTVHGSAELSGLKGIRDMRETGGVSSFLYSGDLQELLKLLCVSPVTDLTIAEPDLEEIFMHYYAGGDEK